MTTVDYAALRKDVNSALEAVGKKYGVELRMTNIRYSEVSFKSTIEGTINNVKSGVSGEQELFNMYCADYGFKPEDYNKQLTLRGRTFKFVGFNTRRPKNCCKIVDIKTKEPCLCPKETAKAYLR